jgi:cytochrome c-type biogenesis protein
MTSEIPFFTALLAGAISFVSPCVLPLVPPYLCYMAGASLDTLSGKDGNLDATVIRDAQRRAIIHSLLFVFGFSLVFIALGAGASTIGQLMRAHLDTMATIAGIIIIIMGLHFLGLFKIGVLYREARFTTRRTGLIGSFLMGIAFAFGWTPCIGPVLGVILAMASASHSVGEGAAMLAVYSAGLGIPFLLAALFVGPFIGFLNRFKKHLGTMEKITGALLVLTGILFLTGGMQAAAFWLLETFPSLGAIG